MHARAAGRDVHGRACGEKAHLERGARLRAVDDPIEVPHRTRAKDSVDSPIAGEQPWREWLELDVTVLAARQRHPLSFDDHDVTVVALESRERAAVVHVGDARAKAKSFAWIDDELGRRPTAVSPGITR